MLRTRLINEGDKVEVYWHGPYLHERVEGVVNWTPADAGDMWHIKTDDGKMIAVNPNCSYLVSITKKPSEKPSGKEV